MPAASVILAARFGLRRLHPAPQYHSTSLPISMSVADRELPTGRVLSPGCSPAPGPNRPRPPIEWPQAEVVRLRFAHGWFATLLTMAKIAYLECSKCGEHVSGEQPQTICPKDGGSLYVRYDVESLKGKFTPDS